VDLICLYGSYVTGTANDYSDLDFYYIPRKDPFWDPMESFIYQDIGYDFWPIPWNQVEALADFAESRVSLVGDALVVYARNEEVRARFTQLQDKIKGYLSQPDNGHLLWRLEGVLIKAKALAWEVSHTPDDWALLQPVILELFDSLLVVLGYYNQSYVHKGGSQFLKELDRFSQVPKGFEALYKELFTQENPQRGKAIADAAFTSVLDMVAPKGGGSFDPEGLKGFYEELKSTYNKVLHAIETQDEIKAIYSCASIDKEVRNVMGSEYSQWGFFDLLPLGRALDGLRDKVLTHEKILVEVLKQNGIPIKRYTSLKDF